MADGVRAAGTRNLSRGESSRDRGRAQQWRRRGLACAWLACWLAVAWPGVAAAAPHGDAGAQPAGASPTQPFDRARALENSQAALGRQTSDFVFTGSDGRTRNWHDYRGKPLVVSLVFTSCAHICPATTQQLRRGVELARQALGTDSFNVVTIGFDVARDTPDMMAEFARRQRAELPGWDFLSADKATIDRLSAELGFVYQPAGGGFDHLIQSTIVDQDGVVYRQVYGIDFKLPHFVEPLKALVFGIEPDQSIYEELTNRIRIFCTVYDPASDSYRFSYSIFVGLVVGLLMGTAAIWALIREWRGYRRASKGAVGA